MGYRIKQVPGRGYYAQVEIVHLFEKNEWKRISEYLECYDKYHLIDDDDEPLKTHKKAENRIQEYKKWLEKISAKPTYTYIDAGEE